MPDSTNALSALILFVLFLALLWFFIIKPKFVAKKKREKTGAAYHKPQGTNRER